MTHILITDLREIRYMAYVPENRNVLGAPEWYKDFDKAKREHEELEAAYRSDLEKAKRESIEFDKLKDRYVIMLNVKEKYNTSDPGIYQVPVDKPEIVDVFEKLSKEQYESPENQNRDNPITGYMKKVARLKSSEPKEESQEELWRELIDAYDLTDQSSYGYGSLIKKLSSLFTITRKRG